jgi:release factor glutamine methyltransferase
MINTIKKFRNILSREGYLAFYLAYGNGNKSSDNWKNDSEKMDGNLKLLIDLFLLTRPKPADEAIAVLGQDILDMLIDNGIILSDDGTIRTDRLILICFNSIMFFCEHTMDPQVYFGNDSIALGIFQTPLLQGRSIDLCAGSAIQSLIAAQSCEFAQAIEINPKAAKIASFNIRLNDMSGKVDVKNISLEDFAKVDSSFYDLVTFNPPLLPVPLPLFYPFVGDGGEDGLDVTRSILHLYIPKLTSTGSVEFIGCGLGKDGYPSFVDALKPIFEQYDLSYNVHILGKGKLEKGDISYEKSIVTTAISNQISRELCYQVYDKHYKKMDANEMYCFFIKAYRHDNGTAENKIIVNSNPYLNWFIY